MMSDFSFSVHKKREIETYARLWRQCDSNSLFRNPNHLLALEKWVGGDLFFARAARDGSEVMIPFMVKWANGHGVLNSLPHFGSCGGIIGDDDPGLKKIIIEGLLDYAVSSKISVVTLVDDWRIPSLSEAPKPNFEIVRTNQFVNLSEDNFERLHHKTRNLVRKSWKSGFTLSFPELEAGIAGLKLLHEETMDAIGGKKKNDEFFQSLLTDEALRKMVRLSSANLGDETVAYLLLFRCGDTVEYYMPAQKSKYRSLQPMSYLISSAMDSSLEEGAKIWNWGGTWETQTSLRRFKIRWGSDESRYRYCCYVLNEEILGFSTKTISEDFDGYFVVPFDALSGNFTAE